MSEGLNEEFMYTRHVPCNMAKLYWRVKRDGKWTWTPAKTIEAAFPGEKFVAVHELEEE